MRRFNSPTDKVKKAKSKPLRAIPLVREPLDETARRFEELESGAGESSPLPRYYVERQSGTRWLHDSGPHWDVFEAWMQLHDKRIEIAGSRKGFTAAEIDAEKQRARTDPDVLDCFRSTAEDGFLYKPVGAGGPLSLKYRLVQLFGPRKADEVFL